MWKWLEKVIGIHEGPLVLTKEVKPKRARTKKGRYRADNKSTKSVNEAWVGGKSPRKKKRPTKKKRKVTDRYGPWKGNL